MMIWRVTTTITLLLFLFSTPLFASATDTQKRHLYEWMAVKTDIPWYKIAAIDQYERTMTKAHTKTREQLGEISGIYISAQRWSGPANPTPDDSSLASISMFGGIGRDGNGDGKAERARDEDLLFSIVSQLLPYGQSDEDFAIGLWEYYQNSRAVQRIEQFAKIYKTFGTTELQESAFPLPKKADYSYKSTWGTKRSWGGRRIHEGTDIFAGYGVPVQSSTYGIVEMKGWNDYGGWRIGIRDTDNRYHYYAHLAGFSKTLNAGDVVKPGQTIGWVGSSGYGKPGTSGKFPPHLHYGIYRDYGLVEWSFDPYPLLKQWERTTK